MSASLGLKGNRAVVIGINPSGIELVRYLVNQGAEVTLADALACEKARALVDAELDTSRFTLECGEYNPKTFENATYVIVASGIPLDLPVLELARTSGARVVTEIEFVSLYSEVPVIAVAGTNGKSTTAHLLENMLANAGKKVFSNVHLPMAKYLNTVEQADYLIAVATSFQLEGTSSFAPKMVLFTNFSEDHLDKYPNIETYFSAYREVFKNANQETVLILNGLDPNVQQMVQGVPGKFLYFSSQGFPDHMAGGWVERNTMNIRRFPEMSAPLISFDLKNYRMRGTHNRENALAAVLAAVELGVESKHIQAVLENLRSLPHRVDFVKKLNSVAFYDDSSASNPNATMRTLQAFAEPVIMIAGGRDKNVDYSPLIPHIRQRVKNLILVGEAKEKINRAIGDFTETFLVGTVEEAVIVAYQKSRGGDVILLSPACSPEDQFASHVEKGAYFRELIGQIAMPRRPNVL